MSQSQIDPIGSGVHQGLQNDIEHLLQVIAE